MKKTVPDNQPITLPTVKWRTVEIPIEGETPLISNRWSERAIAEIEDKQAKRATKQREARNPTQEFKDSIYRLGNKPAFPGAAFKKAAVEAARQVEGLAMTEARVLFHVLDELVEIKGTPVMRRDMVRLETGTWSPAYRAEYKKWGCKLRVRFNNSLLSLDQLVNLFDLAGNNGVGCWRPSSPKGKSGSFGMFRVKRG